MKVLALVFILSFGISLEKEKQDQLDNDDTQINIKLDKDLLQSFKGLMKGSFGKLGNPLINDKGILAGDVLSENDPSKENSQSVSDCVDDCEKIPEISDVASFVDTAIEVASIFATELVYDPLSLESLVLEVLTIMAEDDVCEPEPDESLSSEKDKTSNQQGGKIKTPLGVAGDVVKGSLGLGSKVAGIVSNTADLKRKALGLVPNTAKIVDETDDCVDPGLEIVPVVAAIVDETDDCNDPGLEIVPVVVAVVDDCNDPGLDIVPTVVAVVDETDDCNDPGLEIVPVVVAVVGGTEECQDLDSGTEKTINVGPDKQVKVKVEGDPPTEFIENKDGNLYSENEVASVLFLQNIKNLKFFQGSARSAGSEKSFLSLEKDIEPIN